MKVGTLIRVTEKSPWPERVGRLGVVVAPSADGTYPQPDKSEVLVKLAVDPLGAGTGRGWTCVMDRKSVEEWDG